MSATKEPSHSETRGWLSRWTTLDRLIEMLSDEPGGGLLLWARTTAGIVAMLLVLQLVTGVLLAFYYVPSADHAHVTVAYVEKVLPAGSWLRALHHHGSQWLALFLFLHLVQLFWRRSYDTRPVAWIFSVALLALILSSGATGYSLPWDARAFFSTRVAEGIAGGLPLIGDTARAWLTGGNEISTLTLSRFFALHVFVTPALILLLTIARLFVLRDPSYSDSFSPHPPVPPSPHPPVPASPRPFPYGQFTRHTIAAGLVFLALALYSRRFPAPLGPAAATATPGYLPRPSAQFLWLYQLLKYVPGSAGSLVATVFPGLLLLGLATLSLLRPRARGESTADSRRVIGLLMISAIVVLVATMTTASYVEDRRNPRTRQQLARQAAEEAAFRNDPFVPSLLQTEGEELSGSATRQGASSSPGFPSASGPPEAYTKNCATCHGGRGEGSRQGPLKFPPLLGMSSKPRRTVDDIIAILNDPKAYGLEPPMKSFAGKLTNEEQRQIAGWVAGLKK